MSRAEQGLENNEEGKAIRGQSRGKKLKKTQTERER